VILVWAAVTVSVVAIILLMSHTAKPPARTDAEQAAVEWAEQHLSTRRIRAICGCDDCVVWGVSHVLGRAVVSTPAISLDCSAKPCVMVKP
jgi:hypothetical protein